MLALLCLLLAAGASSAQAAHIHGQWLPSNSHQVAPQPDAAQLPGGEDHCPLCMAMHSALPAATHVELVGSIHSEQLVAAAVLFTPDSHWHFALFSRPPPVLPRT